jgi:hypothetical protein
VSTHPGGSPVSAKARSPAAASSSIRSTYLSANSIFLPSADVPHASSATTKNGWMPEMHHVKSCTSECRRGGNRQENDMRVWVKRDHSILGMMAGGTSSDGHRGTLAQRCLPSCSATPRHCVFSLRAQPKLQSLFVATLVLSASCLLGRCL